MLKPGTHLIDSNDTDLVVVKNNDNNLEVTIVNESTSPMMVVATTYYHIYASRGKLLATLF